LNGCAAVLIALIDARLTGKGQFIDLAQIECMMPFAAPWIIAHSIDGKAPVKYGNRHPDFVPHGCFACDGEDNWVVVAVSSDAMWPKLATLLDRADWEEWLDREARDSGALVRLLRPAPDDLLTFHPVSTRVNSARNDDAALVVREDPLTLFP